MNVLDGRPAVPRKLGSTWQIHSFLHFSCLMSWLVGLSATAYTYSFTCNIYTYIFILLGTLCPSLASPTSNELLTTLRYHISSLMHLEPFSLSMSLMWNCECRHFYCKSSWWLVIMDKSIALGPVIREEVNLVISCSNILEDEVFGIWLELEWLMQETIPIEEVFKCLECTPQGLDTSQVQERLGIFGYNKLQEKNVSNTTSHSLPWLFLI